MDNCSLIFSERKFCHFVFSLLITQKIFKENYEMALKSSGNNCFAAEYKNDNITGIFNGQSQATHEVLSQSIYGLCELVIRMYVEIN